MVRRKKAKAKSRTARRPALWQKTSRIFRGVWRYLAPACYLLAVLILFQFAVILIVARFNNNPDAQAATLIRSGSTEKILGLPVRLTIPSIRVNALVRHVGVTRDGSMGVPKLPRDTAWYMLGPKPGEEGSAVISGHVDWLYGVTGVFQHLKTLKPGDVITIEDEQGGKTSFVVREIRTYGYKDDASAIFQSNDGKAHLNLITCAGVWDKIAKMYSKRLVVFTDKVE